MHDLDRTVNELEMEMEAEMEFEGEFESGYDENEFEFESEYEAEFEGGFDSYHMSEEMEMEMAAELLSVSSDEELEMFLGKLISKAGSAAVRFAKSSAGRQLGGMLKSAAKTALPMVGGAIGSYVAPGIGGTIGAKLGSAIGNSLELEMRGMNPEDMEFETARRLVRIAGQAARDASHNAGRGNAASVAKNAVIKAVKQHTHPVRKPAARRSPAGRAAKGMWVRRGNTIVLMNV